MAREVRYIDTCDLQHVSDTAAEHTSIRVALGDKEGELDLCTPHYTDIAAILEALLTAGRPVGAQAAAGLSLVPAPVEAVPEPVTAPQPVEAAEPEAAGPVAAEPTEPAAKKVKRNGGGPWTCYGDCPYPGASSRSTLAQHVRSTHDMTLTQWELQHGAKPSSRMKAQPTPCGIGDCPFVAELPQGAAVHRKSIHGMTPEKWKELQARGGKPAKKAAQAS